MDSGKGRREVPDSEDEPMTSSPVHASDSAADKLFATARVPLQDAQDALQEATDTHQATADSIANVPGERLDGLDDDPYDASIDVDASKHVQHDMQSDTTTSSQRQLAEASSTAHPLLSRSASSPKVGTAHMDPQQNATATISSLDDQQEAEREMTDAPNATTASDTNFAPSSPKAVLQFEQMREPYRSEPVVHKDASEQIEQRSLSEATHDPRQITDPGVEQSTADATAADSSGEQRVSSARAKSLGSDLDAKHATLPQSAHKYTEATVVDLGESCQIQTGESAPDTANENIASANSVASESALKPRVDAETDHHTELTPNPNFSLPTLTASIACSQSQTASTHAGSVISTPIKEPVPPPGVTSIQAAEIKGDLAGREAELESSVTAMDVDTSPSKSTTGTQTTEADGVPSSSHSTKALANAPAMDKDARKILMDTTDVNITANSQEVELAVQSSAAITKSTSSTQSVEPNQPHTTPEPSTVTKTPQEITLAELKAQKSAMLASLAALPAIQVLMEEHARSDMDLSENDDEPTEADIMTAANKIVKDHIKLLHEYNELKDVGQGLMGLIADQRGVRIIEVQEEFGIEAGD